MSIADDLRRAAEHMADTAERLQHADTQVREMREIQSALLSLSGKTKVSDTDTHR